MVEYRIAQLALPLDHDGEDILRAAARLLRVERRAIETSLVERKSVDARDKAALRIVYGLRVGLGSAPAREPPPGLARRAGPPRAYRFPLPPGAGASRGGPRPVVVGAGPAGLFAALVLAEAGFRPLLLERGDPVEERHRRVGAFFAGGALDPESNIQFGEGGAGTYSDGKLVTQVRDEAGRDLKVIEELVRAGAPAEIAWLAKPHVGTDRLISVVAALRRRIIALGGEVRFRSRVEGFVERAGRLAGLRLADGVVVEAASAVLATGHSARDTATRLLEAGIALEAKPFAVGLRIEHPQEMISRSQYGPSWRHPALPAADYRLAARSADGRGVYSFCMCPGGSVVNASSEPGGVACNGMSDFARDGRNANAAIVVSVGPEDFGGGGPLAGIAFQRRWEALAYGAAGSDHSLPVQLLGDYLAGRPSRALGGVSPSITGPWSFAPLGPCLPPFVAAALAGGLASFGRSLEGFDRPDAILVGVETRTSSPIRVPRDGAFQSSLPGLFPCGEGAGYAGGIMSAAMDGIRVAEALVAAG